MKTEPREATVKVQHYDRIVIHCPYAPPGRPHTHTHNVKSHGPQRFAPGCGITLNPDHRAAGYVFTTTPPRQRGITLEEGNTQ